MEILVITAIAYAAFQVFASYGAQKMSDLWFLTTGTISIVIFTVISLIYQFSTGKNLGEIKMTGVIYVLFANAAITLFTLYLGKSFQLYKSSFVIPIVFGTAILLSTTISFIIKKNIPTPQEFISLVLICGGLVLLGVTSNSK